MALKDNASLALIPAAYKTSKVYSAIPTNGDGDFTFSRSGIGATRINKAGLVETMGANVPRLNYDLTNGTPASCPSLLLEPSRTNNILQSNDPAGANWTDPLSRWTLLTDTTTAPDGGTVRIIELTESGGSLIRLTGFSIAAATYTVSFYIKDIDGNLTGGNVDVGDEGSGAPSPAFGDVGNDWVRATRTITTTATKTHMDLQPTFSGSTNKVAIWGVQLEAGSYATSLIPTSGSAVTRSADICNNAGTSAEFNDSEGVLFVEFAALANDLTHRRIAISDGTTSNLVYISFDTASNRILANANGKTMVYTVTDETDFQKAAVYYNATAPKLYVNGVLRETETAMTAITGLSELAFDNGAGGNNFYGKAKQVMVFNEALTDSELEELTS